MFQMQSNDQKIRNNSKVLALIYLLHAETRGNVQLRSIDPNDPPLIDPKYFQNNNDVRMMLAGKVFPPILCIVIIFKIY